MKSSKKLEIEERLARVVKNRGGKIHSDYEGMKKKMSFSCEQGHKKWMATPDSILRGTWCPECAKTKEGRKRHKMNIDAIKKIAKERGGKCLSKEYLGMVEKLKWQCKNGHVFLSSFPNIRQGRWCPFCQEIERKEWREQMRIQREKKYGVKQYRSRTDQGKSDFDQIELMLKRLGKKELKKIKKIIDDLLE